MGNWNKCPGCGITIDGAADYCPHCGEPWAVQCPNCGLAWRFWLSYKFCPSCGAPTTAGQGQHGSRGGANVRDW